MKIILLGAPGAGKGTQAEQISSRLNVPAISTGFIIRQAMADKTEVGILAKDFIDKGQLLPDDVVIKLLLERIKSDDCKNGYILDGFPRTISQAIIMEELPIEIDVALEIDVDEEIIVDRLSGRRVCRKCGATYHVSNNPSKKEGICDECGGALEMRKDDVPEVIRHRLEVYNEQTKPLKDFYKERDLLVTVKGCDEVDETKDAILKALRETIEA